MTRRRGSTTRRPGPTRWTRTGLPKKDPTLKDPNCVFQLLKKHYSRYTLDKVSTITGHAQGQARGGVQALRLHRQAEQGRAPSSTPWAGRSTPSAPRTSAPWPSSSSCSATWASPAAASTRSAASRTCRAPRTRVSCSISCRGTTPRRSASVKDLTAYIEKFTPKTKDPKSVNWLSNRAKYITSYLKAIYGANGDQGERLRLRLAAEDRRRA